MSVNYRLLPYEIRLRDEEHAALAASARPERRRALSHRTTDGDLTYQALVEGAPHVGRRKNSTYLTHGVHRYKGKFYPQLAKALVNIGLPSDDGIVVDPFGGSGTVALESSLLGLSSWSFDINPLAVEIARAKLSALDLHPESTVHAVDHVARLTEQALLDAGDVDARYDDDVRDELLSWFAEPILKKLVGLLAIIEDLEPANLRPLLRVMVSDLVREVSHQDPKDLRIRRRADPPVDIELGPMFTARLRRQMDKIAAYWRVADELPSGGTAAIRHANSADPATWCEFDHAGHRIGCVVSSPPYAAALPYIDTDRLSLALLLGFGKRARAEFEGDMVGSREIRAGDRRQLEELVDDKALDLPDSTSDWLASTLALSRRDAKAGFRKKQSPAVLARYFANMSAVLRNISSRMQDDAHCFLVLGDSKITLMNRTFPIPTVGEVASIAEFHGLTLSRSIPITVSREDVLHSRHAITRNEILHLRAFR